MMLRHEHSAFRQIEFLPLSGNRVLAILVTSEGEVHNRIVNTDRSYSPAEPEQAANYLNDMFTGWDLHEVRKCLVADMKSTREHMDQVMLQAVEMAQRVMEAAETAEGTDDCFIAGQTNLMEFNEWNSTNWRAWNGSNSSSTPLRTIESDSASAQSLHRGRGGADFRRRGVRLSIAGQL